MNLRHAAVDDPVFWKPSITFLKYAIAFLLAGIAAFEIVIVLLAPDQKMRALLALGLAPFGGGAWYLLSRGWVKAAVWTLALGAWTYITVIASLVGGLSASVVIMYPLTILLAGWMIGSRAAAVLAVLTAAATLALAIGESLGKLPQPVPPQPVMRWVILAFVTGLTAFLIHFFVRSYRSRLEELRLQGERLQLGQATARMIVMDWDIPSDTIAWSDSPGWLRGPLPADGRYPLYRDQVHPEDRERWLGSRNECMARLGSDSFDYRFVRTDGQVLWLHSRRTVFAGPDGKAARVLAALHDITARKEAELALAQSERRFRDFANASAQWFWETDAQGRFCWMSESIERFGGFKPEWYTGKKRTDLAAPDYDFAEEPWKSHLETLERHQPFRDFRYKRITSAEELWMSVGGTPCFAEDGRFTGYRGSGIDITETVRAERQADATRKLMRSALEDLGEMICLTDAEERIVFANRQFIEFNAPVADHVASGRRYDEHLRAGIAIGLFPDAAGDPERWIDERMAHRRRQKGPVERRRQDGRWLLVNDQVLPDGSIISYGLEITERKRAEEALRDINAELERRVAERTSQLESTYRELESFSYSVSHDLRAPLRAVTGFATLLLQNEGEKVSEEGRRYLGIIDANARRMAKLIDALLALGRYTRVELNRTQVDMEKLAREACDELAPAWPGTKIEVGALPPALGNATLLKQVFLNLVSNALKYSANAATPKVEIRAEGNRYIVGDNGTGFDMAYAGKLFQPFERLHTEREYEGTGIGLAIVKLIVERHGGQVEAQGTPGGGASFSFTVGGVV